MPHSLLMRSLLMRSLLSVLLAIANVMLAHGEAYTSYESQVQQMYVAYYGRPGDPGGIDYWADRLAAENGNWIADLVNAFGTSEEYTERFGAMSDDELIGNLYQQLFNRDPDPLGQSFYVDLLNRTNQSGLNPSLNYSTLAEIALDISNGAQGEDIATLDNKLYVAAYFTNEIIATGRTYVLTDIPDAVEIVSIVGPTNQSVSDGLAAVDAFIATPEGEARLNQFSGDWTFAYTIISLFSHVYFMDDAAYESDGDWFLLGEDEIGDIVIATWDANIGYLLLDQGSSLDRFYMFDFVTSDTVSGCYHQDDVGGTCYDMVGTRFSDGVAIAIDAINADDTRIETTTMESVIRVILEDLRAQIDSKAY